MINFDPFARYCVNCNTEVTSNPKTCGGCKVTLYCGEGCQKTHWKERLHSIFCKQLKAAQKEYPQDLNEKIPLRQRLSKIHDLVNLLNISALHKARSPQQVQEELKVLARLWTVIGKDRRSIDQDLEMHVYDLMDYDKLHKDGKDALFCIFPKEDPLEEGELPASYSREVLNRSEIPEILKEAAIKK